MKKLSGFDANMLGPQILIAPPTASGKQEMVWL